MLVRYRYDYLAGRALAWRARRPGGRVAPRCLLARFERMAPPGCFGDHVVAAAARLYFFLALAVCSARGACRWRRPAALLAQISGGSDPPTGAAGGLGGGQDEDDLLRAIATIWGLPRHTLSGGGVWK